MAIFQKHEFKREEHVYENSEFSELLKDAVRFFHGTPVLPLPLEESFEGAGVYAIYCISKKGLYKAYGERINRLSYEVPIYVGKAVPSDTSFSSLSLNQQLSFWQSCFRSSLIMTSRDFHVRVLPIKGHLMRNKVYEMLKGLFKPLWNQVFKADLSLENMSKTWCAYHDLRFHRKITNSKIEALEGLLEGYFTAS